jgi:hypothetical protein
MLTRQNAVPSKLFEELRNYTKELDERPHIFMAFAQATSELPRDIKELIWSFNPPSQPPRVLY